jgi:hypothetical protein
MIGFPAPKASAKTRCTGCATSSRSSVSPCNQDILTELANGQGDPPNTVNDVSATGICHNRLEMAFDRTTGNACGSMVVFLVARSGVVRAGSSAYCHKPTNGS